MLVQVLLNFVIPAMVLYGLVLFLLRLLLLLTRKSATPRLWIGGAEPDLILEPNEVANWVRETEATLEVWAQHDPRLHPSRARLWIEATFRLVLACRTCRDLEPARESLFPSVFTREEREAMQYITRNEIPLYEDLTLERIDLVQAGPHPLSGLENIAALITYSVRAAVRDERSGRVRGRSAEDEPERRQELWSFQQQKSDWRVRRIEKVRGSLFLTRLRDPQHHNLTPAENR